MTREVYPSVTTVETKVSFTHHECVLRFYRLDLGPKGDPQTVSTGISTVIRPVEPTVRDEKVSRDAVVLRTIWRDYNSKR